MIVSVLDHCLSFYFVLHQATSFFCRSVIGLVMVYKFSMHLRRSLMRPTTLCNYRGPARPKLSVNSDLCPRSSDMAKLL